MLKTINRALGARLSTKELAGKLPASRSELPTEVHSMIDMEKLLVRQRQTDDICVVHGEATAEQLPFGGTAALADADRRALSQIIQDLNRRFSTSFSDEEVIGTAQLGRRISEDEALRQQLSNGSPRGLEATFRQVAAGAFGHIINENSALFKKVTDKKQVSVEFFGRLFEWFLQRRKPAGQAER